MKKKRILYFYNGIFDGGGIQSVIFNFFNKIDKDKYHIDFVLHGNRPEEEINKNHLYLINMGSKLYYVPKRSNGFRKNSVEIKRILLENHYDIVHTHMDAAGYYPLIIAKECGIKILIAHSHNTNFVFGDVNPVRRVIHSLISEYCRYRIRHVANIKIAVSEKAGKWLFGGEKFIVLPNAIECEKYLFDYNMRKKVRREFNLTEDDIAMVNVGRLDFQKNQNFLIKIMRKLGPKFHLFCVGEGPDLKKLKEYVYKLNLENVVIFLGLRNDVNELLQGMDLFLLPSRFEGLPVSLIEAQASGLPCIVSDKVSREGAVSSSVEFVSLKKELWVNRIQGISKSSIYSRISNSKKIKSSRFNIEKQILNLEKIYDGR